MLSKILYEIRDLKLDLERTPTRYCIDDIIDRLNDLEDLTSDVQKDLEDIAEWEED